MLVARLHVNHCFIDVPGRRCCAYVERHSRLPCECSVPWMDDPRTTSESWDECEWQWVGVCCDAASGYRVALAAR